MSNGKRPLNLILEPVLAILVLVGIAHSLWFLTEELFLPQPFFYAVDDTYMDWFNVSYWANVGGAYDTFNTIYPPISFVFLKIFSLGECYETSTPGLARLCDWVGLATLHGFFILNIFLVGRSYFKLDPRTALWRTIAASMGLPMLYTLNRGQLLIVCFTFVVLAFGNIVSSARFRWIATAIAINFKPYLIASLAPHLLKRRWSRFEGCVIAVVAVYAVTWIILGDGSPIALYRNIVDFEGFYQAVNVLDLWYSGTYIPMVSLAQGPFPLTHFVGSTGVEIMEVVVPLLLRSTQLLIIATCMWSFFRSGTLSTTRLALLCIGFTLISVEAGGYTQIILLYFVFMEKWHSPFQKVALVIAYILAIPAEFTFGTVPSFPAYSYYAQRPVYLQFGVGLGSLLRPALLQIILILLAADSLRQLYRNTFASVAPGAPAAVAKPAAD
ncbi:hypothetical protein [Iodidimonas sp. SYSU 1G8]|uniref:hypothetical protein n=1 Tax=Iodidimonas sp. SYSU 1G8 TaxID=3133967 RepID=UPI0031FF2541